MQYCNRCMLCKKGGHFLGTSLKKVGGGRYNLRPRNYSCKTRNVLYVFVCPGTHPYVGQTSRDIRQELVKP